MRLLLLSPYPAYTGASLRYRWEQYRSAFEAAGITMTVRGFQSMDLFIENQYSRAGRARRIVWTLGDFARRPLHLRDLTQFDLVVVQREATPLGPPLIEPWLYRRGVPFIYDYDDALFVHDGRGIRKWLGWQQKISSIIRWSRHTIAGNAYLAAFARQHSENVTVIPTVPDTDVYRVRPIPAGPPLTLGWSGSAVNSPVLDPLHRVFRDLSQRHDLRLYVAGTPGYPLEGVRVTGSTWRFPMSDTQVWKALAHFDVGLMPLEDTPWNRGKCGFKALLYMSMGIPPVVSPVGVNRRIVQDGVNGFLASTPQDWAKKLDALLSDAALRGTLGQAARETIEADWSLRAQAPRLIDLLKEVANG